MSTQIRTMPAAAVTQQDLDTIIGLDNQIRSLQQMRNEKCASVLTQMIAGAVVEPGHHSAGLQQSDNGAARVFHLLLDGRQLH